MSQINAFRIVNLNYNDDKYVIDDKLFTLGANSTLFNLENGQGKTVIIQMLTSLFVNRSKRKMVNRNFADYFNNGSKRPTTVMVEWKADDGNKFFLCGMTGQKSSNPDKDTDLDLLAFTCEYDYDTPYSIKNLQFIEDTMAGKSYKTFAKNKEMFKELSNNIPGNKFKLYNMNDYSQQRRYFDTLKDYGIDNKVWEKIIYQINNSGESGLSELFDKSRSSADLLNNWIIPTVQEKYDTGKFNIKNLSQQFIDALNMKKDLKEVDENIEKYSELESSLYDLKDTSESYKESLIKKENYALDLAHLQNDLVFSLNEYQKEIDSINNSLKESQDKVDNLNYLSDSKKYREIEKELENNEKDMMQVDNDSETLRKEINDLENQKLLYEIAHIQEEINAINSKKEGFLAQKELKEKEYSSKELKDKLDNLGAQINANITELYNSKNELYESVKEEQSTNREQTKELKVENGRIHNEIIQSTTKKTRLEADVHSYLKSASNAIENFKWDIVFNVENKIDLDSLELTKGKIDRELARVNDDLKALSTRQQSLDDEERSLSGENKILEKFINESKIKISLDEEKISKLENELAYRSHLIHVYDLEEDDKFNTELLVNKLTNSKAEKEDLRFERQKEKDRLLNKLNCLKSNRLFELDSDLTRTLEENGIEFEYTLEVLYRNKDKMDTEFINPLLPYSIMLNEENLSRLENLKNTTNIFTDKLIPIISEENFEKLIDSNEISTDTNIVHNLDGDIKVLYSFNDSLLDEEDIKDLTALYEKQMVECQEIVDTLCEDINELADRISVISNQEVNKEIYVNLNRDLIALKERTESSLAQLESNKSRLEDLKLEQADFINDTLRVNKQQTRIENEKQAFDKLYAGNESYSEKIEQIAEFEKIISENKELISKNELVLERNEENRSLFQEKLSSLDRDLSKLKRLHEQYKAFDGIEAEIVSSKVSFDEIYRLISSYENLIKESSESIGELNFKIEECNYEIENKTKDIEDKVYGKEISPEDWKGIEYNREIYQSFTPSIASRANELYELERKYTNLKETAGRLSGQHTSLADVIFKTYEKEPAQLNEIFNLDYEKEIALSKSLKVKLDEVLSSKTGRLRFYDEQVNKIAPYIEFINVKDNEYTPESLEGIAQGEINEKRISIIRGFENARKDASIKQTILRNKIEDSKKSNLDYAGLLNFYRDIISNNFNQLDNFKEFTERLDNAIALVSKNIRKEQEKTTEYETFLANITYLIYDYLENIDKELDRVDSNSSIQLDQDKNRKKTLLIQKPKWEDNEESYSLRLDDTLQQIIDDNLNRAQEQMLLNVERQISIEYLYDRVVGLSNIKVKILKVEPNNSIYKTWDDVLKCSGAEKFSMYFFLITSLMDYMSFDRTQINRHKRPGKVLLMDNPFAETYSEHVLKPMRQLAEKINLQLICFSGLHQKSIYDIFDTIYVLQLRESEFNPEKSYMDYRVDKGQLDYNTIVPFKVEVEQITIIK